MVLFLFSLSLRAQEEEIELLPDEAVIEEPKAQIQETGQEPVEIEKSNIALRKKLCKCDYFVDVPYKQRRSTWGSFLGFQWGAFIPVNYEPSFSAGTLFDDVYQNKMGAFELTFGLKLNFFLGSIAAQITSGYFSATTNTQNGPTLTIIPVMAGIRYALDNLFGEPYVVPYVAGGMYTGLYTETQQGLTVTGNSAFAPYYALGALFQLDWLDRDTHESGYEDFGLENTFLYAEMRSFMTATNNLPDLSTPLQLFAGLQLEF